MWTIVAVFAAACISATVAPYNCANTPDIEEKLKKFSSCYKDGKPPKDIVQFGKNFTLLYVSNDALVDRDLKCIKGIMRPGYEDEYLIYPDGREKKLIYLQRVEGNKIIERDQENKYYDIWPTTNGVVYGYYRCCADKGDNGTGQPMMSLYVACGHQHDCRVKEEVARFLACAKHLNVNNLVRVPPCECK